MNLKYILNNIIKRQFYSGTLPTTYTSNSYVSQTAFNRIAFEKAGGIVVCHCNLAVASMPKSSSFTQIGTVDFGSHPPETPTYVTIPYQKDGTGVLLVQVLVDGTISIYNNTTTTLDGFCRAQFPIALKP